MSTVQIPLSDLLLVLPFKGTHDARYQLNGVLVTPYRDHALIVATNGYVIAICESRKGRIDQDRILNITDEFAAVLREKSEHFSIVPELSDIDGRLVLHHGETELAIQGGRPFIDATFPDWRRVIPAPKDLEPGLMAPLSSEYVAWLEKPAKKYGGGSAVFPYHHREKPQETACVVRYETYPQLIVAIMPMRAAPPSEWPAWMGEAK